jgi:serine/threonine protein kinase/tetratricopeptide (TPR) repeat protein
MTDGSVGPYVLVEKLGSGGMGEVYLAEDTRLRRKVALKRVTAARLGAASARDWLLHEARAAATLTHRNIAAIFDIIETDTEAWIVMEYVPGETLGEYARRVKPPVSGIIDIALQLTDGLAAAHAAGVIHRDLKPSNIRVTADGTLKILDFGTATVPRSAADPEAATVPTSAADDRAPDYFTPAYAAPEQLLGRPTSARSDIYSVGVVLYELLTGERPYEGTEPVALALSVLTLPVPDPALNAPEVPPALSAVVKRAMAGDPEARFPSVVAFHDALKEVAGNDVTTAPATNAPATEDSPRTRPLVTFAAIALLAVAIAAGWAWFATHGHPSATTDHIPTVAVLPLANLSGNPSNDYLGYGVAETLISDLTRLSGITVVSRARTWPTRDRDLARIAGDLGVNYVVDGSVQESANRLKVTARLVRGDGSVTWGGSYEGAVADLFSLQGQLAEALSTALQVRLTATERSRLAQQPTRNLDAFTSYSEGLSRLERADVSGNIDRAIDLLVAATDKDRNFALAHAALGEAYWARYQQTKDPQWTVRARAATLEALRLDSEQPAVRHSLAVIYRGTGEIDKAVEELYHALALGRNSDDAHQMLGEILADKGQLDDAIGEFRQAIALRPNFWGHYDALGLALYRAGRFSEAATAFERVTTLQPDSASGFQRLGTAYHAAGDTNKALVNYQRALELSPTPKAYANLGFFYYREQKYAEAAEAYQQALKLDPGSHLTHHNLGDVLQRLGRRDDARNAYATAVDITNRMLDVNPKDAATMSYRALYEAKLEQRKTAEQDADRASTLAPSSGQVLYNKAVVFALAGKRDAALKTLEDAVTHGASASVARDDDDLRSIRGTPEFDRVTAVKR